MLDRDVGLALPEPEHTAEVPAAREIRVECQGAIDQRHYGGMRTVTPLRARARRNSREPRCLNIRYSPAGQGRVLGDKSIQNRSSFGGFRIFSRQSGLAPILTGLCTRESKSPSP